MNTLQALRPPCSAGLLQNSECGPSLNGPSASSTPETLGFMRLFGINVIGLHRSRKSLRLYGNSIRLNYPIKAKEDSGAALTDDSAALSGTSFNFRLSFFFLNLKGYQDLESFLWDAEAFLDIEYLAFSHCFCLYTCLELGNFDEIYYK